MAIRFPMPWEDDQTPSRQSVDLEPREVVESTEIRTARVLAEAAFGGDPDKGRRGAEKGAEWYYREATKAGVQITRQEARERMNRARSTVRRRRKS